MNNNHTLVLSLSTDTVPGDFKRLSYYGCCYYRSSTFHAANVVEVDTGSTSMIQHIPLMKTDRRMRTLPPTMLMAQHRRSFSSSSTNTENHDVMVKRDPSQLVTSDSDLLSSTTMMNTSIEDFDSTWWKRTQQLLDLPVGSFHEQTWAEAIQILRYWFTLPLKDDQNYDVVDTQSHHVTKDGNIVDEKLEHQFDIDDMECLSTSVNKCFLVLDRLSNELKKEIDSTHVVDEDSALLSAKVNNVRPKLCTLEDLNPIIKLWRHTYRLHCVSSNTRGLCTSNNNYDGSLILTPSTVAQRLSEYSSVYLIQPDGATYSMIFDATSYDPHSFEDGVMFADRYLDEWQTLYEQGLTDTKPDIVAVGTVVHAWAESDLPEAATYAEYWVSRYLKNTTAADHDDHTKLYSSVMLAWARIGKPRETQKWMNLIAKETKTTPDLTSWTILLLSLTNANARVYPNAATRAEQVLFEMEDLHREGKLDQPNVFAYTHAMEAWHKRSRKNKFAASRALSIFERMKRNGLRPTTVSYNTAISSLARAGDIERSEELLREMISLEDDSASPDIRTFTAILSGLAGIGTVKSAEQGESLISAMRNLGITPTSIGYSACISCWAHVAGKGDFETQKMSVERSQAMFEQMTEVDKVEPDVYVYTSLMNVYAKCGKGHCAQKILDEYLSLYQETGRLDLAPTVHTLSTVLSAWSRSKLPDAAEKARHLLHRMENEFSVVPNVYCYSAVLEAYTKSKNPQSVETARNLFEDLRSDRISVNPNAYCYNAMIRVYANVGRAEEAESLLEEMLSGHTNYNDPTRTKEKKAFIKPNAHHFSSVIHAWSKSFHPQAGERAERILQKMQALYQSGEITEPPNLFCFTSVMSCWAHSPSPDGPQRAEEWMRQLQAEQGEVNDRHRKSPKLHPRRGFGNMGRNKMVYNIVMNAWANRGDFDRVNHLFDELVEISQYDNRQKPDDYSYRAVLKSIQLSKSLSEEEKALRKENFLRSISDKSDSAFGHYLNDLKSAPPDGMM